VEVKRFFHTLIFIGLFFSLSACGGGGGGTSSTAEEELCVNGIKTINVSETIVDQAILEDETQCLGFVGSKSQTYRLVLDPDIGDVDIAVHKSNEYSESDTFIVYSINYGSDAEELLFTAEDDQYFYIEIYGWESSNFTLDLAEIDTSQVGLKISQSDLNLEFYSSFDLSQDQKILQELPNSIIDVNKDIEVDYYVPELTFISGNTGDWLDISLDYSLPDYDGFDLKTNINTDSVQVGQYQTVLRLNREVFPHTRIFKDIEVNIESKKPPLTVSALPVKNANFNSDISFTVTAANSNLNPVQYKTLYGPNGFQVNNSGIVTWTADTPIFNNSMSFNWGIKVESNDIAIELSNSILVTSESEPITKIGRVYPGNTWNSAKTAFGDFDNDDNVEILMTDGKKLLYELEEFDNGFVESWVYPFDVVPFDEIRALTACDLNGDKHDEFIILTHIQNHSSSKSGPHIIVIDGLTKKVKTTKTYQYYYQYGVECADLDNDKVPEIIVYGGGIEYSDDWRGISVYRGIDLQYVKLIQLTPRQSGSSYNNPSGRNDVIKIGNVDDDPALEIVESHGFVIDGETFQVEWDSGYFFSTRFQLHDFDGNGRQEIVSLGYGLRIYDAKTKELFEPSYDYGVNTSSVIVDIDGDGKSELVSVGGGSGSIYFVIQDFSFIDDVLTVTYRSTTAGGPIKSQVTVFGTIDIDHDGMDEIIYGFGGLEGFDAIHDGMFVLGYDENIGDLIIEWASDKPSEITLGQLGYDSDNYISLGYNTTEINKRKLVFIARNTIDLDNKIGPRFIKVDGNNNHSLTYSSIVNSAQCIRRPYYFAVDTDLDTVEEYVMPPCAGQMIQVFDMELDSIVNSLSIDSSLGLTSMAKNGDMNNDGMSDVVVATDQGFMYIYDAMANNLIWVSEKGGTIRDMDVSDLDKDGILEIITLDSAKLNVYKYNNVSNQYEIYKNIEHSSGFDFIVADIDGDAGSEVVLIEDGSYPKKQILIYNYLLQLTNSYSIDYGADINNIFLEDLQDDRKNIIISPMYSNSFGPTHLEHRLVAIDALSGTKVWQSPSLLGEVVSDSLNYIDYDSDGMFELIFTTSNSINIIN